jgi:hypothetical protein
MTTITQNYLPPVQVQNTNDSANLIDPVDEAVNKLSGVAPQSGDFYNLRDSLYNLEKDGKVPSADKSDLDKLSMELDKIEDLVNDGNTSNPKFPDSITSQLPGALKDFETAYNKLAQDTPGLFPDSKAEAVINDTNALITDLNSSK